MEGVLASELAAESAANVNIDDQLQKLRLLVGRWEGRGRGRFPTIEPFAYREVLEFRYREGTSYITYEQTTELIDSTATAIEPSHWEAGLIRPREDGRIIMSSAHDSTRVEVLRGYLDPAACSDCSLEVQFESILHGNDPRMKSASREFSLNNDELHYVMAMATQSVPEDTVHLEAHLERVALSE